MRADPTAAVGPVSLSLENRTGPRVALPTTPRPAEPHTLFGRRWLTLARTCTTPALSRVAVAVRIGTPSRTDASVEWLKAPCLTLPLSLVKQEGAPDRRALPVRVVPDGDRLSVLN